jgi:hypothetical protein
MGLLSDRDRVRLARLCGMFGSAHEGERANAAALADKLVRDNDLTWPMVLGVASSALEWMYQVDVCRAAPRELFTQWELDFLEALRTRYRGRLSEKQAAVLNRLHAKATASQGGA